MKSSRESQKKCKKTGKKSSPYRWALTVFCLAIALSAVLSMTSQAMLEEADLIFALLILSLFIGIGIVFDIIGVAVTAADAKPFHSMAAHKEKGAKEALMLLRNASHVSSVCNDVVGDICGIVSGTTAAVIVVQLQQLLHSGNVLISVLFTALISGLTIGGKALGKTFAINQSTRVVYWSGRFLHIFHHR